MRRADRVRSPVYAALAIGGLAAVVWFALGMQRGLLLSSGIKTLCYPWAGVVHGEEVEAPVLSDPVQQFVPWFQFARRELKAGRLPLWNPHQDGGVPLLGNAQSALSSPLAAPVLLLGVERGWNAMLLLKVIVAAVGTFLWLRERGGSAASSSLGALSFSLSGAFIAWLEHPHTLAAAPVPLVLYFAERLKRRADSASLVGMAVATFLVLTGGHPETAMMAALLALAVIVSAHEAPRRLLPPFLGAALGAALAAPAMLPFAEYFVGSEAYLVPSTRHPFALPVAALIRFVAPAAKVGHPIEAAVSMSVVTLVLAVVGMSRVFRDPTVRRWTVIAVAMLLVAYDNPLSRALAAHTSIYWSRILLLLPLPLAVLAATVLDGIRRFLRGRGWRIAELSLTILAVAGAGGELLAAAVGVHAVTPPSLVTASTPLLEVLKRDREPFRVLPLGNVLAPNFATAVGLDDVRGYDALAPAAWRRARSAIGKFRNDMMAPADLAPGGHGLDEWNVKYVIAPPDIALSVGALDRARDLHLEEIYAGPDGRLWRNVDVLPRIRVIGPGRLTLVRNSPLLWVADVDTHAPSTVSVANPFFPGWTANVDGTEVRLEAKVGWPIAVPVPPGHHRVEVSYRPGSFRVGLGVALSGAVLLGFAVRGRWAERISGSPLVTLESERAN